MDDAQLRKALTGGVLLGAEQAMTKLFAAHHEDRSEGQTHRHRTEEALLEIILSAEDMLGLIEQLGQTNHRGHGS
jgi:hypothetical protein